MVRRIREKVKGIMGRIVEERERRGGVEIIGEERKRGSCVEDVGLGWKWVGKWYYMVKFRIICGF